jgi:hypothetical protein
MRRKYTMSKAARGVHSYTLMTLFKWLFALAIAGWLIGLITKAAG